MKLIFISLFLLSPLVFAKNKILYKTCVNCPVKEKENPLYDLSLQVDFKSPAVVTLESRTSSLLQYGSSEDFVAYIKTENKIPVLFIITDYKTLTKRQIADHVSHFVIRNGVLFFQKQEPAGDKVTNVLYSISDFKSGLKTEIRRGYGEFSVDDY